MLSKTQERIIQRILYSDSRDYVWMSGEDYSEEFMKKILEQDLSYIYSITIGDEIDVPENIIDELLKRNIRLRIGSKEYQPPYYFDKIRFDFVQKELSFSFESNDLSEMTDYDYERLLTLPYFSIYNSVPNRAYRVDDNGVTIYPLEGTLSYLNGTYQLVSNLSRRGYNGVINIMCDSLYEISKTPFIGDNSCIITYNWDLDNDYVEHIKNLVESKEIGSPSDSIDNTIYKIIQIVMDELHKFEELEKQDIDAYDYKHARYYVERDLASDLCKFAKIPCLKHTNKVEDFIYIFDKETKKFISFPTSKKFYEKYLQMVFEKQSIEKINETLANKMEGYASIAAREDSFKRFINASTQQDLYYYSIYVDYLENENIKLEKQFDTIRRVLLSMSSDDIDGIEEEIRKHKIRPQQGAYSRIDEIMYECQSIKDKCDLYFKIKEKILARYAQEEKNI